MGNLLRGFRNTGSNNANIETELAELKQELLRVKKEERISIRNQIIEKSN
jgi:hypothetical protein